MEYSSDLLGMLFRFDQDVARRFGREGCRCGGSLNVANFRRSPRGLGPAVSTQLRSLIAMRFSFCCSRCRKRTTPPSLRFHGRSWYLAPVRLLGSVMNKGCRQSTRQLIQMVGVSSRTIARWRCWWNGTFRRSSIWFTLRSQLRPDTHEGPLPDVLFTCCLPPMHAGNGGPMPWIMLLRNLALYLDFSSRCDDALHVHHDADRLRRVWPNIDASSVFSA